MQTVDPAFNKVNNENKNYIDNVPKAIAINQPNNIQYVEVEAKPVPVVQGDMLRAPLVNDPNNIVIVQNGVTRVTMLPKNPVVMVCPCCKKQIQTRIDQKVGLGTYIASAGMCLICCPLFWIPCVIGECKDVVHYCPHCGSMIGTRELIS